MAACSAASNVVAWSQRSCRLRWGVTSSSYLVRSDHHQGLPSAQPEKKKTKCSSQPFYTYFGLEQIVPGRCLFVSMGSGDQLWLTGELPDGWGWVKGIQTILNSYVCLGLWPVCVLYLGFPGAVTSKASRGVLGGASPTLNGT